MSHEDRDRSETIENLQILEIFGLLCVLDHLFVFNYVPRSGSLLISSVVWTGLRNLPCHVYSGCIFRLGYPEYLSMY